MLYISRDGIGQFGQVWQTGCKLNKITHQMLNTRWFRTHRAIRFCILSYENRISSQNIWRFCWMMNYLLYLAGKYRFIFTRTSSFHNRWSGMMIERWVPEKILSTILHSWRGGTPLDPRLPTCTLTRHYCIPTCALTRHYYIPTCTMTRHYCIPTCTMKRHYCIPTCTMTRHYCIPTCTMTRQYCIPTYTLTRHYCILTCTLTSHYCIRTCTLTRHYCIPTCTLTRHYCIPTCTMTRQYCIPTSTLTRHYCIPALSQKEPVNAGRQSHRTPPPIRSTHVLPLEQGV